MANNDTITATLQTVEGEPVRKPYKVLSSPGLFKNGKTFKKGSTIDLDDQTAQRFLTLEEIEAKE